LAISDCRVIDYWTNGLSDYQANELSVQIRCIIKCNPRTIDKQQGKQSAALKTYDPQAE